MQEGKGLIITEKDEKLESQIAKMHHEAELYMYRVGGYPRPTLMKLWGYVSDLVFLEMGGSKRDICKHCVELPLEHRIACTHMDPEDRWGVEDVHRLFE